MPAVQLGYRQLRLILIAAYALFAAGVLGTTALYLWSDREAEVRESYARTSTLARALEEHVTRAFGTLDTHLRNVGRRLAESGELTRPSTPQMVAMLRERAAQTGIVRSIYVYDASGLGHTTSLGADVTKLRAKDFEHTRKVLEGDTNRLIITRVVRGAVTRNLNIPVAVGILADSGRLAGIVGSAILPGYFRDFYESLGLGNGGSVALLLFDGAVLARFPALTGAPADISTSAVFREQVARERSGTVEVADSLDGVGRIVSFRHVPDYGLIVAVTERRDAVLAHWSGMAMAVGIAVAAILIVFLAFLIFSLRELKAHAGAEELLRENTQRIRDLLRRLVGAQETERRWVAADLHDLIAQDIAAVGIEIGRLRGSLALELGGENDRILDAMANLIGNTAGAVRQLIGNLRPPVLDDQGLFAAIGWQVRRFESRTGLQVTIVGQPVEPRAAPDAELALFRILQEALANIAKHAVASHVTIELSRVAGTLRLCVQDDGIGLAPTAGAPHAEKWGMDIMRERAEAVGGEFRIESPGVGTRVIVEIPLADSNHPG